MVSVGVACCQYLLIKTSQLLGVSSVIREVALAVSHHFTTGVNIFFQLSVLIQLSLRKQSASPKSLNYVLKTTEIEFQGQDFVPTFIWNSSLTLDLKLLKFFVN